MAEARVTNIAVQAETEETKRAIVTNISIQAETEETKKALVTNLAIQVEFEYHFDLNVNNSTHAQSGRSPRLCSSKFISKSGSFNLDSSKTVGQTISVTGLGFTPKIVFFFWTSTTGSGNKLTTNQKTNIGWGAMNSSGQRACNSAYYKYAGTAVLNHTSAMFNNECIAYCGEGSFDGSMDYYSMDDDGFTIVVDDQISGSYRIQYSALAGTDITNTYIASSSVPTSTGNHNITAPGFQPDAILFGTNCSNTINSQVAGGMFNIGMASGSANQGTIYVYGQDNVATANTKRYGYNGECLGGPGQNYRESFVSMLSNGFTLNRIEGTGAKSYIYVCLKGGSYKVGELYSRTDGNDIKCFTDFEIKGLFTISIGSALSTQNTLTNEAKVSIGAMESTSSRGTVSFWASNGGSFHEDITIGNYEDEIYSHVYSGAIQGLMDIKDTNSQTDFTAIMDDFDSSPNWISFLAMGETKIINNSYNLVTSDNLTLTYHQYVAIEVQSSTNIQTVDNIELKQAQILEVQSSTNVQIVNNLELTQHQILEMTPVLLSLEDGGFILLEDGDYIEWDGQVGSGHKQTSGSVALTPYYNDLRETNAAIIVEYEYFQSIRQTNAAVIVEYNFDYTLSVQNSTHIQTSDNVIITYNAGVGLSVQNSIHTQTSDEVLLVFYPPYIINNSTHIVTSGSITLGYIPPIGLIVNNSTHAQTSDNVDLFSGFFARIEVHSSVHHLTSSFVSLTAYNPGLLQIQNSTHGQPSQNILLGLLRVNNSSHTITITGNLILTQYRMAEDTIHHQTSGNVVLSQNYVLGGVNSTSSAHTSTTIVFYPVIIENLFGWKKPPIGIGIDGPGIR